MDNLSFSTKKFFRFFFLSFFLFSFCCSYGTEAVGAAYESAKEDEALFLRRIIQFWEEGQHSFVKKELEKYLTEKTPTDFFEYLYALLGDIYLSESNYKLASENYGKVKKQDLKEKVFINYIQCLYESQKYGTLCQECIASEDLIKSYDKESFLRFCFLIGVSFYHQSLDAADLEAKRLFAKNSKVYLSRLMESNYEAEIMEPLANIENVLGEEKLAASLFVKLGDKNPEKKEHYLFQAANIYAKFDKELALQTYTQVCLVGKEKAQEAAYNKLILLMELERYNDLILAKDQLRDLLDKEQKNVLNFALAKSYYSIQSYKNSAEALEEFLNKNDISNADTKSALSMLFSCGEKLAEASIIDSTIEKYEKFFPSDEELPKIYFARALFHKNKENYQKAAKDFEYLESHFPNFEDENFWIEAGDLAYQTTDYTKSRLRFKTYLEKYKNNETTPLCWKYFISSSIKIVEKESADKKEEAKKLLVQDLGEYLSSDVNEKEKLEYELLLSKTKLELNNFDEALSDINALFAKNEEAKQNPEANFLLALCYKNKKDLALFCEWSEKALELDQKKTLDEKNIRLNLFNAYLELSSAPASGDAIAKAAEHLFQAQRFENAKVSLDNLLWLADYYYSAVKEFMDQTWLHELSSNEPLNQKAERSIQILEKIIANNNALQLSSENLFLEEHVLKLSDLYDYKNSLELKKNLLIDLEKNYSKKEKFLFEEKVYFELAMVMQKLKDEAKAKEYFEKVLKMNQNSYYNLASNLYLTRLLISKVPEENRKLDNEEIVKGLTNLKNIKLNKSLRNEPLHLEAALDYVFIYSKMDSSDEKRLDHLLKVKEEFTTADDIISKDYQNSKSLFPGKEKILSAYLMTIDAEICALKAKLTKNKEQLALAEKIYKKINDDNLILTSYLGKCLSNIKKLIDEQKGSEGK
jgi:hypothetical protein